MTPRRLIAVMAIFSLTACGSERLARLNPFTWFGPSEERYDLLPADAYGGPVDRRALVQQITSLNVEQAVGGAIIRAVGLPGTQGHWDGELVPRGDYAVEDGVMTFDFRIRPPLEPTRTSTVRSREVVVGLFVSRQKLEGVRQIQVVATSNSRSVRR